MDEPQPNGQIELNVSLPPEQEAGVFADFVGIWHTPASFVVDFIAAKQPPHPQFDEDGSQTIRLVLDARVVARVRIPPEQVAPVIQALTEQLNQWLTSTGRTEPPEAWFRPASSEE